MRAIRLEGVSFAYPGGDAVLRDITFEVEQGACAALIGPNGAGKSTLLLLLNGLHIGEGTVEVAGLRPQGATLKELRRRVGVVFQDPDDQLFMPVVLEDVALGPLNLGWSAEEAVSAALGALARCGAEHLADRSPGRLSLGERKRVALAAVLAMQPEVLVLDEPTAGLDPLGRHEFQQLLISLPATRLIATHDLDFVRETCEHAILLDQGRVAAVGPARKLLGDRRLLQEHRLAPPDRPHP